LRKRATGLFSKQMSSRAPARPQKKEMAKGKLMINEERAGFSQANESETLAAYQERVRALLERASKATSTRARLQVLLQGLGLMLDDLKSVQAPSEFLDAINKAVNELRALWSQNEIDESLEKLVNTLEEISKSETGGPPPSAPEPRKSFWK
jgi:hypothetical protein